MSRKTYIIDFDSTLVTTESLDELAKIALAAASNREELITEINRITDLGMNGQITFQEALELRLKLFSPTQKMIDQLIQDLKKQISPSALTNKKWFETNCDDIYVVSGGFEDYITPVATLLGISAHHVFANKFLFEGDRFLGYDSSRSTSQAGGKAQQVKELNLSGDVIVIGDGYTDYEVKKYGAADHFWAYTETIHREAVTKYADKVIRSFERL